MLPKNRIRFASKLLCAGVLLLVGNMAWADSTILAGGAPAELKISEASERTLRVERAPLDKNGVPQAASPSPVLVDFPEKEVIRARQFNGKKEIRAGHFRVAIQSQPLVATVFRADGTLVQGLAFNENAGTNLFSFHTGAPVLGLGEGGHQFDRSGYNFPLINGQRYKLAELGTRCFSPFLIGTEGWAMFVSAPVTEKGATSRKVYLPEGNWFDWWTGERKSGKQWVERSVDLATMPIYVRAGAIIPLDPARRGILPFNSLARRRNRFGSNFVAGESF